MVMHNPPHPGEFIEGVVLKPCAISIRQVAARLGVSASTFQRLVAGKSRVSPDMELRLSRVLGRSPESWLALQDRHDLWQARQRRHEGAFPRQSKAEQAAVAATQGLVLVTRNIWNLEVFDGLQLLNWFEEP
jgi:antitoxin HigA-1